MACAPSTDADTLCVTPASSKISNSNASNNSGCLTYCHDIACIDSADTATARQTRTRSHSEAAVSLAQGTSIVAKLPKQNAALLAVAIIAPKINKLQYTRPCGSTASEPPVLMKPSCSPCTLCGDSSSFRTMTGETSSVSHRRANECASCGGSRSGAGTVSSSGKSFGAGGGAMVMVAGGGHAVLHAVVSAVAASKLGIPAQLSSAIAECENVVCARDCEGRGCLHYAASYGHDSCVEVLLGHSKCDPQSQDGHGDLALHFAAIHGHPMCAYHLARACPSSCLHLNDRGESPADAAVTCERGEVLNAMLLACSGDAGDAAVTSMKKLLLDGAVPDTWAPNGSSALMLAAAADGGEAVQVLLGSGATLELQDALGRSALMFAAGNSACSSLVLLLDAGACIAQRDRRGRSVLEYCPDGSVGRELVTARLAKLQIVADRLQQDLLDSLESGPSISNSSSGSHNNHSISSGAKSGSSKGVPKPAGGSNNGNAAQARGVVSHTSSAAVEVEGVDVQASAASRKRAAKKAALRAATAAASVLVVGLESTAAASVCEAVSITLACPASESASLSAPSVAPSTADSEAAALQCAASPRAFSALSNIFTAIEETSPALVEVPVCPPSSHPHTCSRTSSLDQTLTTGAAASRPQSPSASTVTPSLSFAARTSVSPSFTNLLATATPSIKAVTPVPAAAAAAAAAATPTPTLAWRSRRTSSLDIQTTPDEEWQVVTASNASHRNGKRTLTPGGLGSAHPQRRSSSVNNGRSAVQPAAAVEVPGISVNVNSSSISVAVSASAQPESQRCAGMSPLPSICFKSVLMGRTQAHAPIQTVLPRTAAVAAGTPPQTAATGIHILVSTPPLIGTRAMGTGVSGADLLHSSEAAASVKCSAGRLTSAATVAAVAEAAAAAKNFSTAGAAPCACAPAPDLTYAAAVDAESPATADISTALRVAVNEPVAVLSIEANVCDNPSVSLAGSSAASIAETTPNPPTHSQLPMQTTDQTSAISSSTSERLPIGAVAATEAQQSEGGLDSFTHPSTSAPTDACTADEPQELHPCTAAAAELHTPLAAAAAALGPTPSETCTPHTYSAQHEVIKELVGVEVDLRRSASPRVDTNPCITAKASVAPASVAQPELDPAVAVQDVKILAVIALPTAATPGVSADLTAAAVTAAAAVAAAHRQEVAEMRQGAAAHEQEAVATALANERLRIVTALLSMGVNPTLILAAITLPHASQPSAPATATHEPAPTAMTQTAHQLASQSASAQQESACSRVSSDKSTVTLAIPSSREQLSHPLSGVSHARVLSQPDASHALVSHADGLQSHRDTTQPLLTSTAPAPYHELSHRHSSSSKGAETTDSSSSGHNSGPGSRTKASVSSPSPESRKNRAQDVMPVKTGASKPSPTSQQQQLLHASALPAPQPSSSRSSHPHNSSSSSVSTACPTPVLPVNPRSDSRSRSKTTVAPPPSLLSCSPARTNSRTRQPRNSTQTSDSAAAADAPQTSSTTPAEGVRLLTRAHGPGVAISDATPSGTSSSCSIKQLDISSHGKHGVSDTLSTLTRGTRNRPAVPASDKSSLTLAIPKSRSRRRSEAAARLPVAATTDNSSSSNFSSIMLPESLLEGAVLQPYCTVSRDLPAASPATVVSERPTSRRRGATTTTRPLPVSKVTYSIPYSAQLPITSGLDPVGTQLQPQAALGAQQLSAGMPVAATYAATAGAVAASSAAVPLSPVTMSVLSAAITRNSSFCCCGSGSDTPLHGSSWGGGELLLGSWQQQHSCQCQHCSNVAAAATAMQVDLDLDDLPGCGDISTLLLMSDDDEDAEVALSTKHIRMEGAAVHDDSKAPLPGLGLGVGLLVDEFAEGDESVSGLAGLFPVHLHPSSAIPVPRTMSHHSMASSATPIAEIAMSTIRASSSRQQIALGDGLAGSLLAGCDAGFPPPSATLMSQSLPNQSHLSQAIAFKQPASPESFACNATPQTSNAPHISAKHGSSARNAAAPPLPTDAYDVWGWDEEEMATARGSESRELGGNAAPCSKISRVDSASMQKAADDAASGSSDDAPDCSGRHSRTDAGSGDGREGSDVGFFGSSRSYSRRRSSELHRLIGGGSSAFPGGSPLSPWAASSPKLCAQVSYWTTGLPLACGKPRMQDTLTPSTLTAAPKVPFPLPRSSLPVSTLWERVL